MIIWRKDNCGRVANLANSITFFKGIIKVGNPIKAHRVKNTTAY
jgi:hypothetical protein